MKKFISNYLNKRKEKKETKKTYNSIIQFLDTGETQEKTDLDIEFDKYDELYNKRFGKHAYIREPGGTKEQTIEAIKICLEKNEDLLDDFLYGKKNNNTNKY